MESSFHTHIIFFAKSDVSGVPKPFSVKRVGYSEGRLSAIASFHNPDVREALSAFENATSWVEQFKDRQDLACHVKLEQIRESLSIEKNDLTDLPDPDQGETFETFQSPLVAAWDVHLKGMFHPQLLAWLRRRGYILLEWPYVGIQENVSILTLHFLQREKCVDEFTFVVDRVRRGGFSGKVYWEDPLAFFVVGQTVPRSIVL